MHWYIELRYAIPPLVNLSFLFLTPQTDSWDRDYGFSIILQYPLLMVPLLVLAILTLFLLFTSFKLPFVVQPVRLQMGHFSGSVATLLLAAIILPPPLFWFLYLLLIAIYPWQGILFNLFKYILSWLHHTLRSIPPLIIVCVTQRRQNTELHPAHYQAQSQPSYNEEHAMQDV